MNTIALVDLKQQFEGLKEEIIPEIVNVLSEMKLFLGKNVFCLENDFADFCRARYAVGVGSGTDALALSLRACGVRPGDEVITVPNSFFGTAEAIALVGAIPVLVDIDPQTYTIDPRAIEAAITSATRAIIPVHLYGQPADMDPVLEISRRHDLAVIEDACQAHGAEYKGHRVGSLGKAAAFSFYYSKNLGAYGEAGMVVTNDRAVARQVRALRDHGSSSKYRHSVMGTNSRLDELQAAVLRVKLRYLEDWNERRRSCAQEYNRQLSDIPSVVLPVEQPYARHVYHLYVIRVRRRDLLRKWLSQQAVQTGIHYPIPIHRQEAWRGLATSQASFPQTEAAAREILSLPMYPELRPTDINRISNAIRAFMQPGEERRVQQLSLGSGQ